MFNLSRSQKKVVFLLIVLFFFCNKSAVASEKKIIYKLDRKNSVVSFTTVKEKYIVEKAKFTSIDGKIFDNGESEVLIDTLSVDTNDFRRNSKLKRELFSLPTFSQLKITSKVRLDTVLLEESYWTGKLPIIVDFAGFVNEHELEFLATRTMTGDLIVVSTSPILIDINNFVPFYIFSSLSRAIGKKPISSTMAFHIAITYKLQK